jgi:uncharacterized protein YdaT
MPWSKTDFPNAMKNLPQVVRNKAIQIANALYSKTKLKTGIIIATAINHAKKWANRRGLPSKKYWEKANGLKKEPKF